MSKQKFNKKICGLKTNYYLYFFLMNTCLEIKFKGDLCCFCNSLNQQSCQICMVVIDFVGFEHESTKNTMNIDFKKKYQSRLYPYLCRMFYINKSSICCFLDAEYLYTVRERSRRISQLFSYRHDRTN